MINAYVTGRLGAKPEYRIVGDDETPVLSFRIAASYKKSKDLEFTDWVSVDLWGSRGEKLQEYMRVGDMIGVRGVLYSETYEDKEGNEQRALRLRADDVELLGSKRAGDDKPNSAPQKREGKTGAGSKGRR